MALRREVVGERPGREPLLERRFGVVVDRDREIVQRRRGLVDPRGRALYDLKGAPLPDADTAAPVRFLPKWDSSLLAYAPPERERILPERYRKTVIRPNGDVLPTFLVDGFVAGSLNDPVQGAAEIVAASLRPDAEEALARKRSVQMEVGKMEQAKGHKSPVTTQLLPGAMA